MQILSWGNSANNYRYRSPVTCSARAWTWSLLCAGTFVVGAKLGEAVPSDLSVVSESQSRPLTVGNRRPTSRCGRPRRIPSLILVSRLGGFYVLQLVDEFSDPSGDMLVERAGGD
jgi:hypothetical protein